MFISRNYGWINSRPDKRDFKFKVSEPILKDCDLRSGMPPVYDQGQTSSCVAHATSGLFEYDTLKEKLSNFMPARLLVYYNARIPENTTNSPNAGATLKDGVAALVKYGVCDENLWPFDPANVDVKPPEYVYEAASKHKAKVYRSVNQSLEDIVTVLNNGYPVVYGMTIYDSFESDEVSRTGMVPPPQINENSPGGHALLICGVKLSDKLFIVRNSWGADWGDHGYCYVPFDYILDPDMADDFWTINVIS